MTDVAYIVRCQRCGVARKSYNDPRRGISVIECKRPCGNSHYDWTLLRVIPATEAWPPEPPEDSDIPLYVPPPRPPPQEQARDASPSPVHASADRDTNAKESIEFESKGRGSVMRSRSTSAGGTVALKTTSLTTVKKEVGNPQTAAANARVKGEKGDCFVQ